MNPTHTAEQKGKIDALKIAELTTRKARAKQEEWTTRRDKAIFVARKQGASLREIGEATDLSHTAIQKIVDRFEASGKASSSR